MPSRRARVSFAILIGLFGAWAHYAAVRAVPTHPGDFGLAWFGARSLLHGVDPYPLVGPHLKYDWPWPELYPATAFVAVMPLALLPQLAATLLFVFASCVLLAYSVTREDWARIPMFGSVMFIYAVSAAQWSPLYSAAIGLPALGIFFAAKPTIGLALAASGSRRLQKFALLGGSALLLISLAFFPAWPKEWLGKLHYATYLRAPIFEFGGVAVLVVLVRWRRPEARLIAFLACVPQVGSWYEALPLLLVPSTLREALALTSASSLGWLLEDHLLFARTEVEVNQQVRALMLAFVYLPAVIMVLRRPNESLAPSARSARDLSASVDVAQ